MQFLQLLYARNLDVASQAAEAITYLGAYHQDWLDQGALPALAELLQECSAHAQAVGLGARHNVLDPLFPGAGQWGWEHARSVLVCFDWGQGSA
jgi:hypothetical protein